MSLGCVTRHFKNILVSPSWYTSRLTHHHTSARLCNVATPFKERLGRVGHLRSNIRANPIPSKQELSRTDKLSLLRFLNKGEEEGQSLDSRNRRSRWRPSPFDHDIASSYLSVRLSPPCVEKLQADAYVLIAKEAQFNHLQQVMGLLADDLLNHYPRDSDPEGFSKAIVAVLSRATPDCPLTPQRILELYNAFTASNPTQSPPLTPKAWDRIFHAATAHPEYCTFPLESFTSTLLSEQSSGENANARSTWITYQALIHLLMEGEESYHRALAVFQQLVELGRVPKLAQRQAETQGGSFKTIIASTLVRGCLVFDWYLKAAELMLELLQNPRWSRSQGTTAEDLEVTTVLGLEVLHALVHSPTKQESQMCRKLIRALLLTTVAPSLSSHSSQRVEIPHADLLAFYDACYQYRLASDAASVYVHLQSPRIRRHHHYPPPRHSALFWLFDHFADPGVSSKTDDERPACKGYIRMARNILRDILLRRAPVPVVDRPRFIAVTAARGFGFYARQLWELYTVEGDPDRDVVRGNAQMLIRLVKLFKKLQERWDDAERRGPLIGTVQAKQLMDAPAELRDLVVNSSQIAIGHGIEQTGFPSARQSILRSARKFAEHVLESFIATKQPLAMASQEDLNALARAHLILDHIPEGLEALSIISQRGDIPDSKDINVALGAIAGYSPRCAARMLEHMVRRGVEPSASAFGAVLHAALKDKDTELVKDLINRASKIGHGGLTPRAIAALIQSKLSFKYSADEGERRRQQLGLRVVLATMETVVSLPSRQRHRKDHGKDHALSVKMGQKCIEAALRAMHPELAMQFWRTLVKDRDAWDERESQSTRALIGQSIRYQWRQGDLRHDLARGMLEELGQRGVEADGPRENKRRSE